jgi:hypothetical protein
MFSSRIHFRTNTFEVLSHLANRQTTDGRNIHACPTADLFSYTLYIFDELKWEFYWILDYFKMCLFIL